MIQKLYLIFISPRSQDADQRNRELVLNWILFSVIVFLTLYSIVALVSLLFKDNTYVLGRLITILATLFIALSGYYLVRTRSSAQTIARIAIVFFFYGSALYVCYEWGILNPVGILLFGLSIVTAGILLGAKYSLILMAISISTIAILEYTKSQGYITPDTSWVNEQSSASDVVIFGVLFFILGIVSWLFNKQMEASLKRAQKSEHALKLERDLLEVKIAERTRELQEAQLEKIQHVYRFAELGHLSTALFHDLAGNLSSISIDIESMRKKNKTQVSKRIDENIQYIDNVVKRVKSQIQGKDAVETFNVTTSIKDLVGVLSFNARQARTHIIFEAPSLNTYFTGNLTRFRQLIINLLSNAIEAYPKDPRAPVKDRPVVISVVDSKNALKISVTDHGKGISRTHKQKIFDPFYTTKASGSGIGLFIVKQVTEADFGGTIHLQSNQKTGTTFTITLPKREI